MKKSHLAILIVLLVLFFDQALKFWVKTNMMIGDEKSIAGNWFYIHFTENEGMAFGMRIGGENGKLILSLFRIVACLFITYYLSKLISKKASTGLIICISLILAGALGNIIDSAVYGMLFSTSAHQVAEFMPADGGYSRFLHGRVVDMFYFPIYHRTLPDWIPFYGGKYFEFFRPVFNIADSAISCGVFSIIIFQRKFFSKPTDTPVAENTEAKSVPAAPEESSSTSQI